MSEKYTQKGDDSPSRLSRLKTLGARVRLANEHRRDLPQPHLDFEQIERWELTQSLIEFVADVTATIPPEAYVSIGALTLTLALVVGAVAVARWRQRRRR